jgi:hypothetical protein
MSRFDREYFFIKFDADDLRFPSLTPDEDTVLKPYESEVLPFGQKPLIFYNGSLNMSLEARVIPIDPPPDILFCGSDLVVREHLAKKLEDMEIPNLAIQPAIYKDYKKKWHEDYWFLTFTKRFDCWDRERSYYDPDPMLIQEESRYSIYVYLLNEELFQKTPLKERLLFKMGGVIPSPVLAHKSIVELFRKPGVEIISVAEKAEERGMKVD